MRTYDVRTEVRTAQLTAVARATLDVAEFGPWLSKVYPAVAGLLASSQSGPAGPPFARLHRLDDSRYAVEAGFPAARPWDDRGDLVPFGGHDFDGDEGGAHDFGGHDFGGNGELVQSELPGGQVAVTTHVGAYDRIEPAYRALADWLTEHGGEPLGDPWEIYLIGPPTEPDPASWRTEVLQPYRQR